MSDAISVGFEVLLLLCAAVVLDGALLLAGHLPGAKVLMGVIAKNGPLYPEVYPLRTGLLVLRLHTSLMLM